MKTNEFPASFNINSDKMSKILLEDIRSISMTSYFNILSGFRNFANKTFANYWWESTISVGESLVDLRQLPTVEWICWWMSTELQPVGDFLGNTLANVHRIYWRKSNKFLSIEVEHSHLTWYIGISTGGAKTFSEDALIPSKLPKYKSGTL